MPVISYFARRVRNPERAVIASLPMTEALTSKAVFEDGAYARAFERFRRIRPAAMSEYLSEAEGLLDAAGPPADVLDVGCGVGRFALGLAALAAARGGSLDALDRSEEMLRRLSARCARRAVPNVRPVHADFLDFAPRREYALLWASDTLHLTRELGAFVSKAAGLLRRRGALAIRTSSHEQLRGYEWGRFFPAALAIDLERHHDVPAIAASLAEHGFSRVRVREVDESGWLPAAQYLKLFEGRYLSSLRLIDEGTFRRSYARMEAALASQPRVLRNARTTLITAGR